jgi:hypothetical protein
LRSSVGNVTTPIGAISLEMAGEDTDLRAKIRALAG